MGLCDLDGAQSYVQDVQAKYMNDLLSIGVAGFRVDAAKHMWVADIEALQAKLNDVNSGGRPYFYMEVIDQCKQIILFITCQQLILNSYYRISAKSFRPWIVSAPVCTVIKGHST